MIALLLAVLFRLGIYQLWDSPLDDGFHVGRGREEMYILTILLAEVYILTRITSVVVSSGTQIVPYFEVSLWSVVLGTLLAIRFAPVFLRTIRESSRTQGLVRSTGLFVSVLFGIGFSVASVVALHPDVATLESLYQYHLNLAFYFLSQFQAVLGLAIPELPTAAVTETGRIFQNNLVLSARAATIGLVGGLFVVGIPLILIMAVNAAVLFGAFTGILIRNSVVIASGPIEAVLAAPLAYLSSMGLLIAGHTFHEFMAIVVIGVGAGWVGWELTDRSDRPAVGVTVVELGLIQLFFAAFLEVWISSPVTGRLLGAITVDPRIVPTGDYWVLSIVSVTLTTAAVIYVTAWMIRETTELLEESL